MVWEVGLDIIDADGSRLSDPQAAGDGSLITLIPVLHTLNDSYNLL